MLKRLSLFTAVAVLGAAAMGCIRDTRAAVRNATSEPVTVVLKQGEDSAEFRKVAPNTTSEFQVLPFDEVTGVAVEPSGESAQGGKVDLKETHDNVVTVSKGAQPSLESQENPDNTFW